MTKTYLINKIESDLYAVPIIRLKRNRKTVAFEVSGVYDIFVRSSPLRCSKKIIRRYSPGNEVFIKIEDYDYNFLEVEAENETEALKLYKRRKDECGNQYFEKLYSAFFQNLQDKSHIIGAAKGGGGSYPSIYILRIPNQDSNIPVVEKFYLYDMPNLDDLVKEYYRERSSDFYGEYVLSSEDMVIKKLKENFLVPKKDSDEIILDLKIRLFYNGSLFSSTRDGFLKFKKDKSYFSFISEDARLKYSNNNFSVFIERDMHLASAITWSSINTPNCYGIVYISSSDLNKYFGLTPVSLNSTTKYDIPLKDKNTGEDITDENIIAVNLDDSHYSNFVRIYYRSKDSSDKISVSTFGEGTTNFISLVDRLYSVFHSRSYLRIVAYTCASTSVLYIKKDEIAGNIIFGKKSSEFVALSNSSLPVYFSPDDTAAITKLFKDTLDKDNFSSTMLFAEFSD